MSDSHSKVGFLFPPFRLQLAVMWEAKFKEEATKTEPLEEVCGELRDELDLAHKQRLDAFEIKMKPIVVREGPSRKVKTSSLSKRRRVYVFMPTFSHHICLFSCLEAVKNVD